MVILAALSVILVAVFAALVSWRVYVIAKDLKRQLEPVIETVNQTADTVRGGAAFVAGGHVPRPAAAVGMAAGAYRAAGLARHLWRGRRGAAAEVEQL